MICYPTHNKCQRFPQPTMSYSLPLAHKHTFLVSPFPSPSFLKPPPAVHGLLAVPLRGIPWLCIYCFHRLECSNNPRYIHGWPSYLLLVFAQIHLPTKALSVTLFKTAIMPPLQFLTPLPPNISFFSTVSTTTWCTIYFLVLFSTTRMYLDESSLWFVHPYTPNAQNNTYLAHSRPSIDVCGISEYNAVL